MLVKTASFCFALFAACSTFAATSLQDVEKWTNTGNPNLPYEFFEATPPDAIVAENDRYLVIFQSAGSSCPSGNHFLADKKLKTYSGVSANNCDDRKFTAEIKDQVLYFKKNGKITAKYSLPK